MRYTRTFATLAACLVAAFLGAVVYRATDSSETATLAYVAVAGNNHVLVVDLATGRSLRKIYSGATPWRLVPSPDRRRLWVQHWYAGTTAVVDLESHEIAGVVPTRGPGTFSLDGERFLSFDWPSSSLRSYDAQRLELVQEQVTEVRQVYDVVPDPDGRRLYVAQFDPMAEGPRERYGYVVAYPHLEKDSARAAPVSYRTGRSPSALRTTARGAFLLTADRETNGLSLINRLGDGRSIPTCPAPQTILLAPDERRMIAVCWRSDGAAKSAVVSYRTDFSARPWPVVTQEASIEIAGGLVAGAFSRGGASVHLVDRTGGRILEYDPATLRALRDVRVGDEPVDIVVLDSPVHVRDRVAAEESQARRQLKAALSSGRATPRPAEVLTWVETTRWTKAPPVEGAAADGSGVENPARQARAFLLAPDSWRAETEGGGVRLASGGHAVSVEPSGRFWIAPKQNLISTVLALPSLSPDDAVRQLAGDVPGSPFLRGGLAADVVREVREGEKRAMLVGAASPGDRVAHLSIDLSSGAPSTLVEQFPVFDARGHRSAAFAGLVRTMMYDFVDVAGWRVPMRLERIIDGRWTQEVRIQQVATRPDYPRARFDLARLGDVPVPSNLENRQSGGATGSERVVPVVASEYLGAPGETHAPYNSNPPTSGPRLRSLARWGVHHTPVPLELQVHNLEHGGVAIQYNCPDGCREWVRRLEELVRGRELVLVAPYPWMKARIALTAWGRLETLDDLDLDRIRRFVEAHAGTDHHTAPRSADHDSAKAPKR